jgi:hypothetical protein
VTRPRRPAASSPQSFGEGPISIRTRFEKFPASVKGAFVVRGEDPDPHQVSIVEARVARIPGGQGRAIGVEPVTIQVAPHRDVFVPFEFALADLEPGWYELAASIELDGSSRVMTGDRRFAVAWPRGAVHRGRIAVDATVSLPGGTSVDVERVDCEATSTVVQFRVQPPGPVSVRVGSAEGDLPVLDAEVDPDSGKGKATAYPVMAGQPSVTLEFRPAGEGSGKARGAGGSVEVRLR